MTDLLYITEAMIPSRSANSIQVLQMCQAFTQSGAVLELVAPWQPQKMLTQPGAYFNIWRYYGIEAAFPIRFLPGPRYGTRRISVDWFSPQAVWYTKLRRPGIVYTRSPRLATTLIKRGISAAVECHEYEHFRGRGDLAALLEVADSPLLKRIIAISQYLKHCFIGYGFPAQKIFVAPDGVNMPVPAEKDPMNGRIKAQLGIPESMPVAGYAGRVSEDRGIGLLLESALALSEVYFLILGGTKKEAGKWRLIAKENGISNVIFQEFVPPREAVRYLRIADVLVAPYTSRVPTAKGMSPLKLFEYMAVGKPVVISDFPVIREVVADGYNSILVEPDCKEALVAGIRRALEPGAQRMGERARQTAQRFTWQSRAKSILDELSFSNREN